MAIVDFSNLTYCGLEGQNIFSRDLYALDLRNAGVTYLDNVKGRRKVYTGEIGDAWQLYTCPFTPQGSASLAETYIEASPIKVNMEACYSDFWDSFMVENTEISLRGGIPQPFNEWFFNKLRQKMSREYQEIFWQGDVDYSGSTKQYLKAADGIEKKLSDLPASNQIAVTAFTVDNILAQVEGAIQKALDLAAAGEFKSDDFKVLMNYSDVQMLKMALGKMCCPNNQSIFSNYAMGADGGVIIYGFNVIPTMQSRNTIIVGDPKNLILGFDSFDAHVEYRLIDMRETDGSNMFRVIAITNIGTAIMFPEGFVYVS